VIIRADARSLPLVAGCVQCVVTSPPYWQKRDYGHENQTGMESTPEAFVLALVDVFRELRRVLSPLGCVWLNLGDSYAAGGNGGGGSLRLKRAQWRDIVGRRGWRTAPNGYKSKDLTLTPFMAAAALRADGWYLRQAVTWWRCTANEPNRLDRPAVSHEYVFLLTKAEDSSVRNPGEAWWSQSVWKIPASPGVENHPAPMPFELARRCILAGCPLGGLVLDPFLGSGTVGAVAERLGRRWVGTDLSYQPLSTARTAQRGLRFTGDVA
jgi:site-specific DNA-methyltransferase (cytosine-N4-specific)